MDLHIGEIIKKRAREMRIGPTELGTMIDTSKQNVYGIFKRKSIDTQLLAKISRALNHDFFLYYVKNLSLDSDQIIYNPQEVEVFHQSKKRMDGLERELQDLWKENEYLKKINQLLEERNR